MRGRRWIRLLFGREFPLPELLEVWDSLFAADPDLVLVDYICVAMLLRIRWPCQSPPSSPMSEVAVPDLAISFSTHLQWWKRTTPRR